MLTKLDIDRAEEFLTTFNEIERELKHRVGLVKEQPVTTAIDTYARRFPWWSSDASKMRAFNDLRNVLVHSRFEVYEYLSIPSPAAVEELQQVRDHLMRPVQALAHLRRHHPENLSVQVVEHEATLLELLGLIEKHHFTQFPVYRDGEFQGLVTSNGLTFWLVERSHELSLVDLEAYTAADLLPKEEKRANYELVSQIMPLDELLYLFAQNVELEAVLITASGKHSEKPLAIVTASDVGQLRHHLEG